MMNRVVKTGKSFGGKEYLKFLSNPQCSEGDGYGLLGAASMVDKETFDGLWLYIHDSTLNKVKRYSDCTETSPGYAYSQLPGWTGAEANSAADGDFDIALALVTAYLQWGEFMGITDACGEPVSYKKEAINFLKGLTDTLSNVTTNNTTLVSGDIGLDGYFKGGDSWNELTPWANDLSKSGFSKPPSYFAEADKQHIDYAAPSYFHAFADFLANEDSVKYAWNIYQFRRAEASSDWLIGQMLNNEKMIPFAGWVELLNDTLAEFTNFSDGTDFRCAWRTILNAVWHGNPKSSWDPVAHQVKHGVENAYEQSIGKRYARFLWDSRQAPWNSTCVANVGGDKSVTYWGPEILKYQYTPLGEPLGPFPLNWVPGTGSPSAVISQDFNLMAELYRKLETTWDALDGTDHYLKSIPMYFHEWFRLMGMLTLTGNYQALSKVKPSANMKVYLDVDKTVAATDDELTYTISYRNYGSQAAQNVVILDALDNAFQITECSNGGVYDASSHSVKWTIAEVPGFSSSKGIDVTCGSVTVKVKVIANSAKRIVNRATVSCSNGSGWISNEYPNRISSIMKRNYVDIVEKSRITGSSLAANLYGGRPGVRVAFAHAPVSDTSRTMSLQIRLNHDAQEAYVNNASYRVSYFLYDKNRKGIAGQPGVTNGWVVTPLVKEGTTGVSIQHEMLDETKDTSGKWNQRIIINFSDSLPSDTNWNTMGAPTYYLMWYRGVTAMIHRGIVSPLKVVCTIRGQDSLAGGWSDDWSWDPDAVDAESGAYWPITNDWTDPENTNIPVTTWHPKQCNDASHVVDNVLVEEWDGTVWRKVFGAVPGITTNVLKKAVLSTFQISLRIKGRMLTVDIPNDCQVKMFIVDTRGRVVENVMNSFLKTGTYRYGLNSTFLGSKAYFAVLKTGSGSIVRKLSLVK
ncbi:MAG TPA: glycosyl hydrolase family 8, partial [Chitinispirillaceae bacterium]|nr:glycosyl hydrolase family 8 [Chitinispirillaceae bacterium]